MKNKKLLYVLVPAAVIIWGLIFYKIFSFVNTDPVIEASNYKGMNNSFKQSTKDTFQLSLSYPDPFLKKARRIKNVSHNKSDQTKNIKQSTFNKRRGTKTTEKKELSIKYKGFVYSETQDVQKVLLQVEDKTYIVEKELEKFEIRILQIWNDSISIVCEDKPRIIKKLKR